MKILVINRPNAFSHRGGDTELMERVAAGLRARGVTVDIDLDSRKNPADYDLCHLYNFATPDLTERAARRVYEAGVPYVVTTLYEDRPAFFNQMHHVSEALFSWIESGRDKKIWEEAMAALSAVSPAPRWENGWSASHAAALLATGQQEKAALANDYGRAERIHLFHMGSSCSATGEGGQLFRQTYGVSDYVLCVGRLETRKNQLMLLKALEDSDLTVVLAAGGFTYQPQYEEMCRKLERRGRTIITGRLDEKMLTSAYEGARVHALPSWYELPGIVSIEAGRCGAAVVVSDHGTARDYFGSDAWYCQPDNSDSIRSAVYAAYYSPASNALQSRLSGFTWERAVDETLAVFNSVVQRNLAQARNRGVSSGADIMTVSREASLAREAVARISLAGSEMQGGLRDEKRALELCERADSLARTGQHQEAEELYREALAADSRCNRALRGRAVICMLTSRNDEAEQFFRLLVNFNEEDAKSLAGLATSLLYQDRHEEAWFYLVRAANAERQDPSVLLHLTNAAYALGRFEELGEFIGNLLVEDPHNANLLYSYAGCLIQKKDLDQASQAISRLRIVEGDTARVGELRELISKLNSGQSEKCSGGDVSSQTAKAISEIEELKQRGEFDKAAVLAEQSLSLTGLNDSQKDILNCLYGESLGRVGQLEESLAAFRRVSVRGGCGARALTGAGAIECAAGNWGRAESHFRDALEINSSSDNALAGVGMCAAAAGHADDAWNWYVQALDVNPENLRALYGVIELGYRLQRLDTVEERLRGYLACHPADVAILYSLAGCLYAQGKYDEALQEVRMVILLKPDYEIAEELRLKIEQKLTQSSTKSVA